MVALTDSYIIHDTDLDEVILSSIINNDTVVGITAFGYRGIHTTGNQPMPPWKI